MRHEDVIAFKMTTHQLKPPRDTLMSSQADVFPNYVLCQQGPRYTYVTLTAMSESDPQHR